MCESERSEAHGLLHAAIDGELDMVDMMRFETHLAKCPDCSAEMHEHWNGDGQDYWVISDLNHEELTDFAKAWQEK